MKFVPGNQLWQLREKHGRDYLFKTPEALWEAACGYFQWCDEHPVIKVVKGHRSLPVLALPKLRAYTLHGLYVYLGCGNKYFSHFESRLAGKTDAVSEEYLRVISLIRDVIYEQKFTAAAAGELNPGLIARELSPAYKGDIAAKNGSTQVEEKMEQVLIGWGGQKIPVWVMAKSEPPGPTR